MSDGPDLTPGFFGKLPALGDFVQRRLPTSFVQVWDGWLQAAIAGTKAQLGEHWLDTYLSSPLWRFALLRGVAGEGGWAGVVMPSVDRVGRYFPLTIAAPLGAGVSMFALPSQDTWFDAAEAAALGALEEEGFELEGFADTVGALGPCGGASELPPLDGPLASLQSGWQIALPDLGGAGDALQAVAQRLAAERFAHLCLWWSHGSELVAPSLLLTPGLPEPRAYCAMLDGRWAESAWQTFQDSPAPDAAPPDAVADA